MVLSAQATDAGVNKATPALFKLADTPEKMAALGVERITELIKTIGLYRTKAKNVLALSQQLIERFGGEVPADREALESLPGVGRKTANVVLNIAFRQPTIAVDTHLFRVANRTGLAPGDDAARGRAWSAQGGAGAISAPCAPLADPPRPLCLQGAQARMLSLPHRPMVPLRTQDATALTRVGMGPLRIDRPERKEAWMARRCTEAQSRLSPPPTISGALRPMADTQFDVLTIGNAIVDVIAPIEPEFLAREGLTEGIMHLVDAERSAYLYERMPADKRQISGGSSANTAAGRRELRRPGGVHRQGGGRPARRRLRQRSASISASITV